ncbi:hypothetical protein IRJ14_21260, partial [Isoptericola sp. QY 916]|nr:hypothetical protein [Isoptericola sp. QY 916]
MSLTGAVRVVRLEDVADRPLLADLAGAPDPAARYEALRSRWGALAPVDLEPGVPAWLALGHAEVAAVLRNEAMFSRDARHWRYEAEGLVGPCARRACPLRGPAWTPRSGPREVL